MAEILYKDLNMPQAWKPLFQAFQEQGWELEALLEKPEEWLSRPVLVLNQPGTGFEEKRYLYFLDDPIWCGNTKASYGFTTVNLRRQPVETREEVEEFGLSLTANWEEEILWWVPSILDLCATAPR